MENEQILPLVAQIGRKKRHFQEILAIFHRKWRWRKERTVYLLLNWPPNCQVLLFLSRKATLLQRNRVARWVVSVFL
jgi:hypothetical protein